jgi:hypothetical protein
MSIVTGFSTRESSSGRSVMARSHRDWLPGLVPVVMTMPLLAELGYFDGSTLL